MKRIAICLCCLCLALGIPAARGRAESGASEKEPLYWREGDTLVIAEGVTSIGYNWSEDESGEETLEETGEQVTCDCIGIRDEFGDTVRRIQLPSTLRAIYDEAFFVPGGQEITLPGTLEKVSGDAFYAGSISRVLLTRDYHAGIIDGQYTVIEAWEVEEGNELYSSRDGVLFSADGKTLLKYPNGKKDTHYDVPAGVEEIAASAFYDSNMGIPLQTISLPIGLKRIGAWAFSGCGRLHSLAVPLTVTEVGEDAFAGCVSLERLSLPPGLTAEKSFWSLWEDFSSYTGDNGVTLQAPRKDEYDEDGAEDGNEEHHVGYEVWLSGENGEGPVPVYASPWAETPSGERMSGTDWYVTLLQNGRQRIDWIGDEEFWVDTKYLLPTNRDVFFTVSRVTPTEEGMRVLEEEGLAGYTASWYIDSTTDSCFSRQVILPDGVADSEEAYLPLSQVRPERPHTGDHRTFALLTAADEHTPIRLYDAPEGNQLAWTYRGEQAEVLEQQEAWARVRTACAAGWVPVDALVIVEQEDN